MNLEMSAYEALDVLKEHVIDMNIRYNYLMKDNARLRESAEEFGRARSDHLSNPM